MIFNVSNIFRGVMVYVSSDAGYLNEFEFEDTDDTTMIMQPVSLHCLVKCEWL